MSDAPDVKVLLSIGEFAEIALQGRPQKDVARALLIAAVVRLIQAQGVAGAKQMLHLAASQVGNPAWAALARKPGRAEAH